MRTTMVTEHCVHSLGQVESHYKHYLIPNCPRIAVWCAVVVYETDGHIETQDVRYRALLSLRVGAIGRKWHRHCHCERLLVSPWSYCGPYLPACLSVALIVLCPGLLLSFTWILSIASTNKLVNWMAHHSVAPVLLLEI